MDGSMSRDWWQRVGQILLLPVYRQHYERKQEAQLHPPSNTILNSCRPSHFTTCEADHFTYGTWLLLSGVKFEDPLHHVVWG